MLHSYYTIAIVLYYPRANFHVYIYLTPPHPFFPGSGLPVLSTLQDMQQTGDRIHRIEGVFSGTVNYVIEVRTLGRSHI